MCQGTTQSILILSEGSDVRTRELQGSKSLGPDPINIKVQLCFTLPLIMDFSTWLVNK